MRLYILRMPTRLCPNMRMNHSIDGSARKAEIQVRKGCSANFTR